MEAMDVTKVSESVLQQAVLGLCTTPEACAGKHVETCPTTQAGGALGALLRRLAGAEGALSRALRELTGARAEAARHKARSVQLVLERDTEHARYMEALAEVETLRRSWDKARQDRSLAVGEARSLRASLEEERRECARLRERLSHSSMAAQKARAERAEARVAQLEEEVETWKAASGLEVGGDPDGVKPEHLLQDLKARELEIAKEAKKRAAALAQAMRLREVLGDFYAHVVDMGWEENDSNSEGMIEVRTVLGLEPIEPADRCAECDHHRVHHDESLPEGEQCGALAEVNTADCDCSGFRESEP